MCVIIDVCVWIACTNGRSRKRKRGRTAEEVETFIPQSFGPLRQQLLLPRPIADTVLGRACCHFALHVRRAEQYNYSMVSLKGIIIYSRSVFSAFLQVFLLLCLRLFDITHFLLVSTVVSVHCSWKLIKVSVFQLYY